MADDLRKRLSFNNPWFQSQAAWKLYDNVVDKKSQGSVLNETSVEVPELKILWEMCGDSSEAVSRICSQCLVQLVFRGHVDWDYTVNGLLSSLSSARNISGILQALSSLLILQIRKFIMEGKQYKCPFHLRSPPHPFITVLTSRPDAATAVIQHINLLLGSSVNSSLKPKHVVQMLEPVLKFVLLDPRDTINQLTKQQLLTSLLQTSSGLLRFSGNVDSHKMLLARLILDFLMSVVPCYQVDAKSLDQTTYLLHSLTHWLLEHNNELNSGVCHLKVIGSHLLSLCCECLHHGRDMTASLLLLQTIQHRHPEALLESFIIPTLSEFLLKSPEHYHQQMLELCLTVVQGQTQSTGSDCVSVQVCHLLLVLPLLQVLASPPRQKFSVWTSDSQNVSDIALQILAHIECRVLPLVKQMRHQEGCMSPDTIKQPNSVLSQQMRRVIASSAAYVTLTRDQKMTQHWLQHLHSSVPSLSQVPSHVTLMLAAVVVTSEGCVSVECLNVIRVLAKTDSSQAPYFLPLLFYKLGKEHHPEVKQQILYTVPELATHKFCVGQVLRTIQTIGQSPPLKPLSLRLMSKLWQQQSRVFPHLQRALNSVDSGMGMDLYMELQVAKAASILDICSLRPSQHGADLLSLLSKLLDEHSKPGKTGSDPSALVVGLALRGLEKLCQAEVVDLCTAWNVLSAKLSLDRRPQVLRSLCQLFSIVPSLATDTPTYENFKNEVLVLLWSFTRHQESFVACAAYSALSMFDSTDFKLIHLPEKIYLPLKEKFMASKKRGDEDDTEDDSALEESVNNMSPPGSAYVELLQSVDQDVLPGFQKLLTSISRHEAESLPRGLAHAASRGTSPGDRNLQAIPGFLMSQYEKSKTPGLSQGLAAGILFSFEPPIEQHQGKGARRYLVNCARKYRQVLDSLLHEVPVQPSEWHRSMLMPQAWSSFMNRAYHACVEGRKAELEMQHSHGHIEDINELKTRQLNAWLWVRDQITDQLKAASRGNPSVQGNSVLALAGLANAVSSYVSQQNASGDTQQNQLNSDWLVMVADTLMVVLDGNYKPKGDTLVWCQQVSSPSSTASSLLARASAALSLSQLVSSLVTLDTRRVHSMTDLLKHRIPGQSKAGSSAVVQMSCSLGLGLLLSKLYEEHFSDLSGKEGYLLTTTALDALENAVLSQDLENTEGASLGLGVALSSLCEEGIVDSRVHVVSMYEKLMAALDDLKEEPGQKHQSLCFSVACVCVNAFHTGLLSAGEATKCVEKLQQLSQDYTQACGIYLALGLLIHGLASCGHGGVDTVGKNIGRDWPSWFEKKDASELQRLSALNGIMGLLGSEQGMLMVDNSSSVEFLPAGGFMKFLQQLVASPKDLGLATNAAWLLGHIYAATTTSTTRRTNVPSNYSYLPEASTLRPLFDFLVQAGKTGPHLNFSGKNVPVALESLVSGIPMALPPVNWVPVLGPIMRAEFGEEASQLCIKLAVNQAQSSSGLASFLSSLLSPAVFMGLGGLCKLELLKSLSRLVYVITPSKLKEFFEGPLTEPWRSELDHGLQVAIIGAHLSVLRLRDPPASVFGWTMTSLEQIYKTCAIETEDDRVNVLAGCLSLIPIDRLEDILQDTQNFTMKAVIVRCSAVRGGRAPLKWLNPCISWILQADLSDSKRKSVASCVVRAVIGSDEKRKQDDRQQWLLELIGQFKNALRTSSDVSTCKTLQNCFTLLSLLSAAWSDSCLLQGIRPSDIVPATEPSSSLTAENDETLPWLLPLTLSALLSRESWTQITGKVLDWLLLLRDVPAIHAAERQREVVQDTIVSLRQTDAFKMTAVWTDVVARLLNSQPQEINH